MTGKLLAYHLKSPRVPLVVRVPQFENHWLRVIMACGLYCCSVVKGFPRVALATTLNYLL